MTKRSYTPYLFILPAAAMLIVFLYYPVVGALDISLYEWSGMGPRTFVGFGNYTNALKSATFWHSLRLTFLWVLLSTVILPIGGLLLAVLIEYTTKARFMAGLSRTILFMPMMMSLVAVGLLWSLIFNPTMGLLNAFLVKLQLMNPMEPLNLLGRANSAIFAAFVPAIWQWSGFGMVITSAAMMSIPQELIEAAAVDGAGKFKQFFRIILPLLMPTIFTCAMLHLIGGFKAFDLIYTMTAGGPGDATMVSALYMFRQAFIDHKFGYATAIAAILFLLIFIFTYVFNKLNDRVRENIGI
ncbi:MAG: sugar ABC transporter permease [Treponema sp.]|jgi:ABC-type sugar transport system permease subunit|nr:sugar ABC transporter permease [Treponema sp.]